MIASITIEAASEEGGAPGWLLRWRDTSDRPDMPAHTQWYVSCDDAMAVRLLMEHGTSFDVAHAAVMGEPWMKINEERRTR